MAKNDAAAELVEEEAALVEVPEEGANPEEAPEAEAEAPVEALDSPDAELARLLELGYRRSDLELVTDASGQLIRVEKAVL